MRSLKDNTAITPVLVNSDFPNGAIINETSSQDGTAVINEVYNDVLVNIFKIINSTGVATNGVPDSEGTTYQFLASLRKFTNELNDIRQIMQKNGTAFVIPLNLAYLPDRYCLFVQTTDAANPGQQYDFADPFGNTNKILAPNGFNSGDTVLLIINKPTNVVEAYSIAQLVSPASTLTFKAGDPIWILGSDPFFFLPLTGTTVPVLPKYLTMYLKNADSDNQTKMISPAYIADTRIITGMPNPADWPTMEITLKFA